MLRFRTDNFAGSAVQYSPFFDNRISVGASANFGLVGNGRLFVLDIEPNGSLRVFRHFDTQDAIFSTAWSELNENQVVVANGDGTIRLFDTAAPQAPAATAGLGAGPAAGAPALPVAAFKEHSREVFDVEWNLVNKSLFASCSWDGLVKIWDPSRTASVATLGAPNNIAVYQAKFAPRNDFQILTAHGNGTAQILDARTGASQLTVQSVFNGDCMTVDWNKYDANLFASAGADKVIKVWDIRNPQSPMTDFVGHEFAVKSIKWSPHSSNLLLSASYDMSVKVWDTAAPRVPFGGIKGLAKDFTAHTEFATDCDWSLWGEPGWVASVGYDQMLYIFKV